MGLPVTYPDKVPENIEELHQKLIELVWQLKEGARGYWDSRTFSVGTSMTTIAHNQREKPGYTWRALGLAQIAEAQPADNQNIYLIASAPVSVRLFFTLGGDG